MRVLLLAAALLVALAAMASAHKSRSHQRPRPPSRWRRPKYFLQRLSEEENKGEGYIYEDEEDRQECFVVA